MEKEEKQWLNRVMDSECFISEEKIPYVKIYKDDGAGEVIKLKSSEFRDWIRILALEESGEILGNEKISILIETMEAQARFYGREIKVFMRVGKYKDNFYYDLGKGSYVKISNGKYRIVHEVPICFDRNNTMKDQILPNKSGKYGIWDLREFINVKTEDEFILLLVTVISFMIPEIPHHILVIIGNAGSSKSTVSRLIKRIVDPSTVDIYSMPRNKEDLVLHLNNAHLIPYDNLEGIKAEFNDILCQVCTGGSFLKRMLYSDSTLIAYNLKRTLILNGINIATNKADLLDRSTLISLKTISDKDRRSEKEIFDKFEERLPYFLHDIFEVVAKSSEIYKTIEVGSLSRMADALLHEVSIAEALGISKERYLAIYKKNRRNMNYEMIAENAVAYTVMQFMKRKNKWKGSIRDLWQELELIADNHNINKSDQSWAKSPSYLSRYLNQLKVNLDQEGISYSIKNVGTHKQITLIKKLEDEEKTTTEQTKNVKRKQAKNK